MDDAQIYKMKRLVIVQLAALALSMSTSMVVYASEMKDVAVFKDWKVTKVVNTFNEHVEYRAISKVTSKNEAYFLTCKDSFLYGPINRSRPFQRVATRIDNKKPIYQDGYIRGSFLFLGNTDDRMEKQMRAGRTFLVQYTGDFEPQAATFSLMGFTAALKKLKRLCRE
jgi:hypothetical protein